MPEYTDWILREDRIARLTLNRAQQHNTLRRETFQQLREITRRLRDRNDIWAVIVDSAGKHFSSGVDVRVIGELVGQQAGAFRESLRDLQNYLDEFEQLEKATIARLHGYCLGGGLLLALCCDFRVAATDAVFGFPEVKRSIAVLMGTQRITRVTGVATTKEMVLLAENFTRSARGNAGYCTASCLRRSWRWRLSGWPKGSCSYPRARWQSPNALSTEATSYRCAKVKT